MDNDFLMITHSQATASADYIRSRIIDELDIDNIYETRPGTLFNWW